MQHVSRARLTDQPRHDRIFWIRAFFIMVGLVIVGRLFYLQIIRRDYYQSSARAEQFKELELEPERGSISIMDGTNEPLILAINESRYTIVADPKTVKEPAKTAQVLADVLSQPAADLEAKLRIDARYSILAKKVAKDTFIKVRDLGLKGIAWKEERVRVYPQGVLAPQVLGFVNDESVGQYGFEGYYDDELHGEPGLINAITDVNGTPLMLNDENVVTAPVPGKDVVLSIDQTMQRVAEEELKKGVERSGASGGSLVVMDVDNGQVKAMANFPSYNPVDYQSIEDQSIFKNRAVSDPLEPGSIMKLLTMASALDQGVVSKGSTYYDPGYVTIDDSTIRNVHPLPEGTKTMNDIINWSLNTGAIYLLKQMGGGDINEQARQNWHRYLTERYHLGSKTGIEQQEEAAGYVADPLQGDGLRIQYANSAFGQGVSMTMVQYAAALSACVNGGMYYQPTLAHGFRDNGVVVPAQPIEKGRAISREASSDLVKIMEEYIALQTPEAQRAGFVVGGKTGTAQVPSSSGGYRTDVFNATYAGFVGRSRPKYVIAVRLNEGLVSQNFNGYKDGRPVFLGIIAGIMDNVAISE